MYHQQHHRQWTGSTDQVIARVPGVPGEGRPVTIYDASRGKSPALYHHLVAGGMHLLSITGNSSKLRNLKFAVSFTQWKRICRRILPIGGEGAGIAQWLEHRTRDWKVAGSNPCWNGGRIFFSRVDFLCWLLFRYPFHPRVTTVARKKSRSFCQKCRWQVTAKHAYTLRMWILLNRASALVTTCP